MNEALDNPRAYPPATLTPGMEDPVDCRAVLPVLSPGCEDNPYLGDFSRRVAERLACLPERPAHDDFDDGDGAGITWKLLGRSYKLLLTILLGAFLYGASVYPFLSELRSAGATTQPSAQPDQ